jgi:phenylacetyl-CoA:acceptor oxidoreductase subunit 1
MNFESLLENARDFDNEQKVNIQPDDYFIRWVMLVDLRKCIGCGKCRTVCSQTNNISWRRVIEKTERTSSGLKRFYLSMACMHCANPPCLKVCPTKATFQRSDGIVDVRCEICVGCGACIMACPYKAREILNSEKLSMNGIEIHEWPDRIGVSTKCNFCRPIIDTGLSKGLKPGSDEDATPRCVTHCISGALSFGNVNDPKDEVYKIISDHKTLRLREELGTEPGVYFIIEEISENE